jgi:hypothetical protein
MELTLPFGPSASPLQQTRQRMITHFGGHLDGT